MIESIINSALAPFMEPVGWQGFAYGLLGLKFLKKMFREVTGIYYNRRHGGDRSDTEQQRLS